MDVKMKHVSKQREELTCSCCSTCANQQSIKVCKPLDRRKKLTWHSQLHSNLTMYLLLLVFASFTNFAASSLLCSREQCVDACPDLCACSWEKKLVNCSNRSLRQIPQPIPSWTEILSFRNNKIGAEELRSEYFKDLHNLRELDLSDNKLKRVNLTLDGLSQLRILRLDRCALESIPQAGSGGNVTTLSLSRNSIHELSTHLKSWPALTTLDLSYNRLTGLGQERFAHLGKLSHLYLHKNKIGSVRLATFAGLHSLDHLTLARNKIKSLKDLSPSGLRQRPQCAGNLQNLRHLDLSENGVQKIASLTFVGMCRLETLLLNDNRIAELDDGSFCSLRALRTLNLDRNRVTTIVSNWLYDLAALQTLTMHGNLLSAIEPDSWLFSEQIRHLNLSRNQLVMSDSGLFARLAHLEELDLSGNRISVLEDNAFAGLLSLHLLDLSHNRISSNDKDIKGAFYGLAALRTLLLRDNKLRSLSRSMLQGAEGLVHVDLRANNLTSVENETFSAAPDLRTLQIDSRAFLCDCQLTEFSQWLRSCNWTMTRHINATCFHPPTLKGRNVADVGRDEFECGEHPIPTLLQQPSRLSSYRGENVTLECGASATLNGNQTSGSSVDMSVLWRRGATREVLVEGESVRIRNQQRKVGGHIFFMSFLLIHHITYDDEDAYSCVIRNDFGQAMSRPALLQVFALPNITIKPSDVVRKAGSEVILPCQASGRPEPEISWSKDGGSKFPAAIEYRLKHGDAGHQHRDNQPDSPDTDDDYYSDSADAYDSVSSSMRGGGLDAHRRNHRARAKTEEEEEEVGEATENAPLHIIDLVPEDAGVYTCTAKSAVGQDNTSARLVVQYAPTIEAMPQQVRVATGEYAVLKCMARAHPPATVRWFVDGARLNVTRRHFLAADDCLLVIVDVTAADRGAYSCLATNSLGAKRDATQLTVVKDLNEGRLDRFFDELGTTGAIVVAVFVCVLVTSVVWLAVLCHAKRNRTYMFSTNTETTDFQNCDSSSHASTEQVPTEFPHSRTDLDLAGRYFAQGGARCLHPAAAHQRAGAVPLAPHRHHGGDFTRQQLSPYHVPAHDNRYCGGRMVMCPPRRLSTQSHVHARGEQVYNSLHCIASRQVALPSSSPSSSAAQQQQRRHHQHRPPGAAQAKRHHHHRQRKLQVRRDADESSSTDDDVGGGGVSPQRRNLLPPTDDVVDDDTTTEKSTSSVDVDATEKSTTSVVDVERTSGDDATKREIASSIESVAADRTERCDDDDDGSSTEEEVWLPQAASVAVT